MPPPLGSISCRISLCQNMTTNKAFYSRQAWHYVFGIHHVGTSEVVIYINHEGKGQKLSAGRHFRTVAVF
jgi:hypothetical protein